VNLGDSLYGPLDPPGTARILLPLGLPTVRGNEDRIIVERSLTGEESPTLHYVRRSLSLRHTQSLENLPITCVVLRVFRACHGSPMRDDEYLLWRVSDGGLVRRTTGELSELLSECKEPVLLCGHDHVPHTVDLPDGRLIVNPGSVGLPAFADDRPCPHIMQNGSPYARFSIVSGGAVRWHVENIAVTYDWGKAARVAEQNDRPDWAAWLRTGCALRSDIRES